jgi:hypothetical protein
MKKSLLAVTLLLCACPDDKPKGDDRLIQKLQAEQARIAKSGKPAPMAPEPKENPLLAAVQKDEAPRELPLAGLTTASAGDKGARVTLSGMTRSTTLKGDKISLTSDSVFLSVKLSIIAGPAATTLDLPSASVQQDKGEEIPVARDAQAVMGQRLASARFEGETHQQVVLYFDVPEAALKSGSGLKLKIPSGDQPVLLSLF